MAIAARRRRRRRPRWLLVGLALTVAVLLVNAAVSGGSKRPGARLAKLAYLDLVRPLVDRSTTQGEEIAELRTDPLALGRDGIRRRMTRVSTEARGVLRSVQAADPPAGLDVAHSLLVATMAVRARGADATRAALVEAFVDDPLETSVDALFESGEDFRAADRTYRIFVDSLRASLGPAPVPASQWLGDAQLWTRPELSSFVGALRSGTSATPLHDLRVVTVTTDPLPVATELGASVLPLIRALRLEIVVANTGNQAERKVPVVATVQGPAGEMDSARDTVDLGAGQRRAIVLAGLHPVPGGPSTLTVAIGPVAGESATDDNQRALSILLRG